MRVCLSVLLICGISTASMAASVTPAPKCHNSDKYVVMEQPSPNDAVGTNFSIYVKQRASEKVKCPLKAKYKVWKIPNEQAEYFLGLQDNYLILDSGTAAEARDLIIWDLAMRKKIKTFSYAEPAKLKNYNLSYWVRSQDNVTVSNCPNRSELVKLGLGQAIDYQETLNLKTMQVTKSQKTRCAGVS